MSPTPPLSVAGVPDEERVKVACRLQARYIRELDELCQRAGGLPRGAIIEAGWEAMISAAREHLGLTP